ncbi:hypothetical protein JCM33374_g2658 [Metschnikowia sp. JCM 33374]|nr:hypothetical protein JCM33374_g2658 [Metschnikowia sp. JCM 33374]
MAEESDIDTRLADQVTSLSTKLVTEVAKSSRLEETILQLRRENANTKSRLSALEKVENDHKTLSHKYSELSDTNAALTKQKLAAEAKNKQLEGEVEDLTASLFNEANQMVSDASREAYNFKLKNRKLIEELAEKDSIIENLQDQLRDLKGLFVKMEDQQRSSSRVNTPRLENSRFEFAPQEIDVVPADPSNHAVLQQLLYGVRGHAVRFDLPVYQIDFKAFVYQLIKKDFSFDLASLKTLKYFRKLWTEEIEPSIPVIPALNGNTFMTRWSKGKSFWSLLVEGKAIIEPVAGVNETFKLTYKGAKRGDEVPIALKDPCAFCGESKDDLLEHARLYSLKLYGPATETGAAGGSTTEIGGEPHTVIGTYPLCNFCLVKLRAICTFFAKLRVVRSNIYKLPQNRSFDDIAYVNNFQFKRSSESLQTPTSDPESEHIFVKLYLMLLVLRAKIYWSRIGFWDTDEDVEFINLDEIPTETFRAVVSDNVAFKQPESELVAEVIERDPSDPEQKESEVNDSDPLGVTKLTLDPAVEKVKEPTGKPDFIEDPQSASIEDSESVSHKDLHVISAETAEPSSISEGTKEIPPKTISEGTKETSSKTVSETASKPELKSENPKPEQAEKSTAEPKGKKNKKKGKASKIPDSAIHNESTEEIDNAQAITEASLKEQEEEAGDGEFQDSLETFEGNPPLQRRKSKSKEFKAKINKDLDNTLAALQESLEK